MGHSSATNSITGWAKNNCITFLSMSQLTQGMDHKRSSQLGSFQIVRLIQLSVAVLPTTPNWGLSKSGITYLLKILQIGQGSSVLPHTGTGTSKTSSLITCVMDASVGVAATYGGWLDIFLSLCTLHVHTEYNLKLFIMLLGPKKERIKRTSPSGQMHIKLGSQSSASPISKRENPKSVQEGTIQDISIRRQGSLGP